MSLKNIVTRVANGVSYVKHFFRATLNVSEIECPPDISHRGWMRMSIACESLKMPYVSNLVNVGSFFFYFSVSCATDVS